MLKKYNNEVVKLVDELFRASKSYYKGSPIMSDLEFDQKEQELKRIDPTNEFFSVVQSRGLEDTVYHPYPMLSQAKALNKEQLKNFVDRNSIYKLAETAKLDGMSFELVIRDGKISASSRGDGEFGEDYTKQIVQILGQENIDRLLQLSRLVVRGEVVLSAARLVELNNLFVSQGKEIYANPRNGVVGLFNNKVDGMDYIGFASCVVWDVLEMATNQDDICKLLATYSERLSYLASYLETLSEDSRYQLQVVIPRIFSDWNTISQWLDIAEKNRSEQDIMSDGRVFRIDNIEAYEQEGRTAKYRRGSIAYKFPPMQEIVTIRSIEWSVGSRDITPVAIFDVASGSGANITRANLHSVKNMMDLGACVGAKLVLTRQGEVIPKLSKVDASKPTMNENGIPVDREDVIISIIQFCPKCNAKLNLSDNLSHLTCSNDKCKAKLGRRIETFAKSVGIEYVGIGIAEKLAEVIEDPVELLGTGEDHSIMWKRIEDHLGVGVTRRIYESAKNVRENGIKLDDFIAGLSIERLGLSTVRLILENFSIEDCINGKANLSSVRGIATDSEYVLIESLREAFKIVNLVESMGVKLLRSVMEEKNTSVNKEGKVVYFGITGGLSITKEEFAKELEKGGWLYKKDVTAATQYLVTNDLSTRSSKLVKAEQLGIRILSEQEARTMCLGE